MNTYHPFSLTTPSALMIEDWNCVNQLNTKVIAGFTTKNGGVSNPPYESLNTGLHVRDEAHDVVTNREVIASLCGTDLDSWVFADQTHENRVRRVTAGDKGKGGERLFFRIPRDGRALHERCESFGPLFCGLCALVFL